MRFFFSILLAGSTSSVAYLLDPAIKKLFIEQNQSLILIIPFAIVLAFAIKGASLYLARVIMIGVSEEVKRDIQNDVFASLLKADTRIIDEKHTGKFIANLAKIFKKSRREKICEEMSHKINKGFKEAISKNAGIFSFASKLAVKVKRVSVS